MKTYYRIGRKIEFIIGYGHIEAFEFKNSISYYDFESDTSKWRKNYFDSEEDVMKFLEGVKTLSSKNTEFIIQKMHTFE